MIWSSQRKIAVGQFLKGNFANAALLVHTKRKLYYGVISDSYCLIEWPCFSCYFVVNCRIASPAYQMNYVTQIEVLPVLETEIFWCSSNMLDVCPKFTIFAFLTLYDFPTHKWWKWRCYFICLTIPKECVNVSTKKWADQDKFVHETLKIERWCHMINPQCHTH